MGLEHCNGTIIYMLELNIYVVDGAVSWGIVEGEGRGGVMWCDGM